jgi:hypothetical protein
MNINLIAFDSQLEIVMTARVLAYQGQKQWEIITEIDICRQARYVPTDTTVGACRSPRKPAASGGILQVLKTDWGSVHSQWAGFNEAIFIAVHKPAAYEHRCHDLF